MTELNKDSLTALSTESTPLLVDFWAGWCMPCLIFAPVLEEIAQEWDGKVNLGKVDVEAHPQLAAQFGVESIPTLILFQNGKEVERLSAVQPKAAVVAMLERVIRP